VAAGGTPRRLTWGGGKDSAPRWAPDGKCLAFLSDRGGDKPQIYLLEMGGGEARRLTDFKQGAGAPVWSPDGSRLAYTMRGATEQVHVVAKLSRSALAQIPKP